MEPPPEENRVCPQCGNRFVAERISGNREECQSCGWPVIVRTDFSKCRPFSSRCFLGPLVGVGLAVAFVVWPLISTSHRRGLPQCHINLRMIGIALQNYHGDYGSFPPAYIADAQGKPMHSWRVLILPYLDETPLYRRYRFDEPWDGPNNRKLAEKIPKVYRCPLFHQRQMKQAHSHETLTPLTNYVAISDPGSIISGPVERSVDRVSDGLANTLMLVEVGDFAVHWMQPRDATAEQFFSMLTKTKEDGQERLNHEGGAYVLYCDGSVAYFGSDIDWATLRAMTTIAGGERVNEE